MPKCEGCGNEYDKSSHCAEGEGVKELRDRA